FPLTFEGSSHLLRSVLDLEESSLAGVPEVAFERARGNVRFTLEIARLLGQDLGAGRTRAPDLARLRDLLPSADAREIVLRRIERLAPADCEIFSLAALIGRKFSLRLLLEIAGRDE